MSLGNGSTFDTIEDFTNASVLVIGGLCPTEMAGMLAYISENVPQAFQLALANIAGTYFERHLHDGDGDPDRA